MKGRLSPFGGLSALLRREDMTQLLMGLLALLIFVLIIAWPTEAQEANNSWYALTQVKVAALALLGLAYGSTSSVRAKREQRLTLGALICMDALTLPLETAAYAASYPLTPLWWPLVICVVDIVAFFGVGLALGTLLTALRLRLLLPLAVPLVLVGVVSFDVWLSAWTSQAALNPFTAATQPSALHLGVAGLAAAATLVYLARRPSADRQEEGAKPHVH